MMLGLCFILRLRLEKQLTALLIPHNWITGLRYQISGGFREGLMLGLAPLDLSYPPSFA